MVYTRSNIQLDDLKSKPHGRNILRGLINCAFGVHFYPPPGPEHYKPLFLDRFHGYTHTNDNHRKNDETKTARFV